MTRRTGADYWNEVIVERRAARRQTLWRAHADRLNVDLCRAWWPANRPSRVLKTDLFEEASGVGLWPMASGGARLVFGIDQSVDTIRAASATYDATRGSAADVRHLPFRTGVFDVVISTSTLDHFERHDDIVASLAEIARVLAPGGRLILTLDNAANPIVALRNVLPFRLMNGIGVVPYFVGATFGPWRGRQALADAGFHVLDVQAVMHCPRALAVAAASVLDRAPRLAAGSRFLAWLRWFERAGRWPTRFLTGYFVAFVAEKP
ncbi:MAG: class I SAM-dependent methyltransferase [Vicinamibacterales bacterium]